MESGICHTEAVIIEISVNFQVLCNEAFNKNLPFRRNIVECVFNRAKLAYLFLLLVLSFFPSVGRGGGRGRGASNKRTRT